MNDTAYTLAMYRVKKGREDDFVRIWNELADTFINLPNPPIAGTLIRSVTERSLFYSFGPWPSADDVAAMRASPKAGEMFGKLREVCDELTPGDYEVVTHVDVEEQKGTAVQ